MYTKLFVKRLNNIYMFKWIRTNEGLEQMTVLEQMQVSGTSARFITNGCCFMVSSIVFHVVNGFYVFDGVLCYLEQQK
jgi:hypothetical protein